MSKRKKMIALVCSNSIDRKMNRRWLIKWTVKDPKLKWIWIQIAFLLICCETDVCPYLPRGTLAVVCSLAFRKFELLPIASLRARELQLVTRQNQLT